MLKVDSFSLKGVKGAPFTLPKGFEEAENLKLLAQAVRVYFDRSHLGLAKVKTRAEIERTKKKWYKQKGTGGARHGAKSAPIFVGGGVAHGPKPVKKELDLPEKMKRKALRVALSAKAKNGELIIVKDLNSLSKTKEARTLIEKIGGKRFTFVLKSFADKAQKALRNISGVEISLYKDLNAYNVFFGGKIVLDKDIFETKEIRREPKKK